MTVLAVVVLVFLAVAIPVLICSAHIPWLRTWTGAAPLQPEEPDAPPPGRPDGYRTAAHQAADETPRRIAKRPSDMPHGTRRGWHG